MKHILLTAAALSALTAGATKLSPEAALENALQSSSTPSRMMAPGSNISNYRLAFTDKNEAYYIFNNKAEGFIVVASDDASAIPVLGYSTSSTFDPDNIPPAMEWMLEGLSQITAPRSIISRAGQDIDPMVTTKWNQDTPYNNNCPKLNNKLTYTGCMATAIAQVMAYKENRLQGVGIASYDWRTGKQTLTFNYTNNPFEYNLMINEYREGSYNTSQANAVANLMYGVGVACQMEYLQEASGASDPLSGQGLIKYLGCDKGLKVLDRDFYTADEWNTIIYDQLASGRPMVYTGASSIGGHAFVCDGYQYNDGNYYHINWGWGGVSDGYFPLSNLSPDDQGIGGSNAGFNYMQSAFLGIRPPQQLSQLYIVFYQYGALNTNKSEYRRTENITFSIDGPGEMSGMVSGTLDDVKAKLGFKFTNTETNEVTYRAISSDQTVKPGMGYQTFKISANTMPSAVGSYIVELAMQIDGKWYEPMKQRAYFNTLTVTTDATKVTFTNEDKGERLICNMNPESSNVVRKQAYKLSVDFAANAGAFDEDVLPVLVSSRGAVVSMLSTKHITLADHEKATLTWDEAFNPVPRKGTFYLAIVSKDGNNYQMLSNTIQVKVVDESGIDTVNDENSVYPVEYYNLQGVKIDGNPMPGTIVIRRQGTKADKIIVR